jgi:D-glycero-D-manno-heptose 1,7-bisphosphate phosphatase
MKDSITAICQYYKEKGIIFSDVEYCPYHIESKIKEYKYDSLLRKPNAGMILNACKKFRIDLKKSVMIGDNEDIDNIRLPYIKCIINKTGK